MAVFVYPDLGAVIDGVRVWDHVKGRVAAYLAEYGRPDQVAAWQEGRRTWPSWQTIRPASRGRTGRADRFHTVSPGLFRLR